MLRLKRLAVAVREKFESLRKEIKADVRKQHDLYVNNLVGDIKANPRDFYRYINSHKKDTQGIPPLKRRNGSGLAESELEQAEEFNGQFMDVFNKSEYTQVPLPNRSAPFLKEIHVSAEGVTKLLKGLNPSKALGPDELHPRVLKEQTDLVLVSLTNYFFQCDRILDRGKRDERKISEQSASTAKYLNNPHLLSLPYNNPTK